MSSSKIDCSHFNEIIDERNGDIICSDCGLCLDLVYDFLNVKEIDYNHSEIDTISAGKFLSVREYILDLLERLNISNSYRHEIENVFIQRYQKYSNSKKYQLLTYLCYEILNKHNIPISIKDVAKNSNFSIEEIYDMQENGDSIIMCVEELLEKYCNLLNLSYYDFSVIKKKLPKKQTGHNPLTIVGSLIYAYCIDCKSYIDINEISSCLGISKISIQRYYKKYRHVLS